jgi:NADH:ubiquinone oxidoreductase subunit 6 (subunit J)
MTILTVVYIGASLLMFVSTLSAVQLKTTELCWRHYVCAAALSALWPIVCIVGLVITIIDPFGGSK